MIKITILKKINIIIERYIYLIKNTIKTGGNSGIGCLLIGTHPIAAALAKGNHAATEAIFQK